MSQSNISPEEVATVKQVGKWAAMTLVFLLIIIWGWRLASPRYTLYSANIDRQVLVREAEAERDAAVFLAEAEVERARGVAEANEIIAESITPDYIRWLYVDQMDQLEGQVIYIPTEGGLPILEAGRLANTDQEDNE